MTETHTLANEPAVEQVQTSHEAFVRLDEALQAPRTAQVEWADKLGVDDESILLVDDGATVSTRQLGPGLRAAGTVVVARTDREELYASNGRTIIKVPGFDPVSGRVVDDGLDTKVPIADLSANGDGYFEDFVVNRELDANPEAGKVREILVPAEIAEMRAGSTTATAPTREITVPVPNPVTVAAAILYRAEHHNQRVIQAGGMYTKLNGKTGKHMRPEQRAELERTFANAGGGLSRMVEQRNARDHVASPAGATAVSHTAGSPVHERRDTTETRVIRQFETGIPIELYKTKGTTFTMAELNKRLSGDPGALDAGCAYVQTVKDGPDGNKIRGRLYFDPFAMYDLQKDKGIKLDGVDTYNHEFDITIGEVWRSPMGETDGVVENISMPFNSETDGQGAKGQRSPMVLGRERLDSVLGRRPETKTASAESDAAFDAWFDGHVASIVRNDHAAFPEDGPTTVHQALPDYIPDGFVDMGRDDPIRDLQRRGDREQIWVDKQAVLERFKPVLKKVLQADYSRMTPEEKALAIADDLSKAIYFSVASQPNAVNGHKGIGNDKVRLSEVTEGLCRDRSLMFSVLGQAAGLEMRLVKGIVDGENHATNLVKAGEQWYLHDVTKTDYVRNARNQTEWRAARYPVDEIPVYGEPKKYAVHAPFSGDKHRYVARTDSYWYVDHP